MIHAQERVEDRSESDSLCIVLDHTTEELCGEDCREERQEEHKEDQVQNTGYMAQDQKNQVARNGHGKYDSVDPDNLENREPGVEGAGVPNRWYLYDHGDDCETEVDPVLPVLGEVPPIADDSKDDLGRQY